MERRLGQMHCSHVDPLIGSTVDERYRVIAPLGRGGMGSVYLVEHVMIRRKLAIKTLHPALTTSADIVERFRREALAAAAIGNAHIVDVTDMGQLPSGAYYIVLEYLEGADLAWTVANEGRLSIARCLEIALQVCDGLQAVHRAGIVHRDLKPENLFLVQRSGQPEFVKILDFGVCKFRQLELPHDRRLTDTGVALGTPDFMSPEQIEASAHVDVRADIYALGAILYFALTGQPPFSGASLPQLYLRVLHEAPPSLRALRPEVSPELQSLVARALVKAPGDRFQDALELRAALLPLLTAERKREAGSPPRHDGELVRSTMPPVVRHDHGAQRNDTVPAVPQLRPALRVSSVPLSRMRTHAALRLTLGGLLLLAASGVYFATQTDFAGTTEPPVLLPPPLATRQEPPAVTATEVSSLPAASDTRPARAAPLPAAEQRKATRRRASRRRQAAVVPAQAAPPKGTTAGPAQVAPSEATTALPAQAAPSEARTAAAPTERTPDPDLVAASAHAPPRAAVSPASATPLGAAPAATMPRDYLRSPRTLIPIDVPTESR